MSRYEQKNRTGLVITLLVVVIILLSVVVLYSFLIQPKFNGFVVDKQNEGILAGQNYVVQSILTQVQQNGYVEIPVGENQTLVLVPYQQPAQ